jgi:hypothetical protein
MFPIWVNVVPLFIPSATIELFDKKKVPGCLWDWYLKNSEPCFTFISVCDGV